VRRSYLLAPRILPSECGSPLTHLLCSYHLMLMPLAIRQQIPTANMGTLHYQQLLLRTLHKAWTRGLTSPFPPHAPTGFFLHIPFPSSEVYKILPCRAQLLEGVLSCDLVGFHTWDYSEHFLKTCTRILGAETQFQAVIYKDRRVPGAVPSWPRSSQQDTHVCCGECSACISSGH
jgi:hypothetical protein